MGSRLKFSANAIVHRFEPGRETEGACWRYGAESFETALYLGHEWTPNEAPGIVRYTLYQNFGETTIYQFDNTYQLKDSTQQGGGIYHHHL